MTDTTRHLLRSPHGHGYAIECRDGTTDWDTAVSSQAGNDEYHLPQGLGGWAIDVGAHIGTVTVPLLLDNPDLRCIAIEALPENVAMLRANIDMNGLAERCIIVHGAASDSPDDVRIGYSLTNPSDHEPTNVAHRYIGSMGAPPDAPDVQVHGVTLRGAMLLRGPDQDEPFAWAKIDCEGCEYAFLGTAWNAMLTYITGEVHLGWQRLVDILEPTHTVSGPGEDFGAFQAVLR